MDGEKKEWGQEEAKADSNYFEFYLSKEEINQKKNKINLKGLMPQVI